MYAIRSYYAADRAQAGSGRQNSHMVQPSNSCLTGCIDTTPDVVAQLQHVVAEIGFESDGIDPVARCANGGRTASRGIRVLRYSYNFV